MYKVTLLENLKDDHKFCAEKYAESRNVEPEEAERYLRLMHLISKNMADVVQMTDHTIGKHIYLSAMNGTVK